MINAIRRRLGVKLFLSYLLVILVGTIVLAMTTELSLPSAYQRHFSHMSGMMSGMGMGMSISEEERELFANFRAGVNYTVGLAALSTFTAALIVSWFVARRVVRPVREMVTASQRIADGDYHSRVQIPGSPEPEEMDELGRLALRFNQMAHRLDQTEAMRRQLIGDIAHELRTPLTTIKGSMEGLVDKVLPANEETFMRVYQEADRLQRLVMDLQELSRVEANAVQLLRQPSQLKGLIVAVVEHLEPQFEDKGVSLEVTLAAPLPPIEVDADRIQQVLINLVGNALQYTPAGGAVKITARPSPEEITVAVEDSGIGIPPEHLPHIFNRFYRVEKSRSRAGGGSGIGLTIAKHLVEAHGGRIWAQSAGIGRGSIFAFTIPLQPLQKL